MLSAYVLLDILKCMDCDGLEKIQITNRAINNIVKSEFSSKPLRLFDEDYFLSVEFMNGKLSVLIHRKPDEFFVPSRREWQKYDTSWRIGRIWSRFCVMEYSHGYPFDEMCPFLSKNVRFKYTIIEKLPIYFSSCIFVVESFAHIWAGETLYISDHSLGDVNSFSFMLNSTNMLQCRNLCLYGGLFFYSNFDAIHYSPLFEMQTINFGSYIEEAFYMFHLIQIKAAYPHSNTTFVFTLYRDGLFDELEKIRKDFLESTNPCRLKIIFHSEELTEPLYDFRDKNSITGEALELKYITNMETRKIYKFDGLDVEYFHWPLVFSLERYII
ncbi:hypothetical protein Ddc_02405 [Ditylenchus destructor]|nr:hypothetical protein Ddc_02405 [Ditylenchus destructor]